ncbi:MAG: hypothetical protein Q4B08_15795 [Propionibacteriaceae bacterium]|nr:hypothetical protein [Propionibacteriaceae bacterium]
MKLVREVVAAVAWSGAPLIAAAALFWGGAAVGLLVFGAGWLVGLAAWVSVALIGCVLGSFLIHELRHALALACLPTIHHIGVERRWWRISLRPHGELTPAGAGFAALAGPGASVLVGLVLMAVGAPAAAGWVLVSHAVFWLPVFGDGRALLLTWRERDAASRRAT